MLQLLLIPLGIIVVLMGLSILVKQELWLSRSSKLDGRNAIIAGVVVIAIGAATVFKPLVGAAQITSILLRILACVLILAGASVRNAAVAPVGAPRGTFASVSSDLSELRLAGQDQALGVTSGHPIWSLDRGDWIAAGALRPHERLATAAGEAVAESVTVQPGERRVYNLSVQGDARYLVGSWGCWRTMSTYASRRSDSDTRSRCTAKARRSPTSYDIGPQSVVNHRVSGSTTKPRPM